MNNTLQTTSTARNPFLAYAEAMTPRRLDGTLLRFIKGDFALKEGKALPIGTKLVAIMNTLTIGWVKWMGGKPVDYRMGLVIDGFTPPRRADLDDYEGDNWEKDGDGDPRDPWQFVNTVVFTEPATRAMYTFSAPSRGAIGAIGELCKAHAKAPAASYPLISLESGSYQHPDRTIGRVKFPIFRVLEFVAAAPYDDTLTRSRGEGVNSPAAIALPEPGGMPPTDPLENLDDEFAGYEPDFDPL